jgi:hypothetical protein
LRVDGAPPGGRVCPPSRGVADERATRFRSRDVKCRAFRAGTDFG